MVCVCFALSLMLEIHTAHISSSKQNILSLLVTEVGENILSFSYNMIGYGREEGNGKGNTSYSDSASCRKGFTLEDAP